MRTSLKSILEHHDGKPETMAGTDGFHRAAYVIQDDVNFHHRISLHFLARSRHFFHSKAVTSAKHIYTMDTMENLIRLQLT